MIQIRYFLCAESVLVDALTNQVSIINVVESFSANAFPVFVQKAAVVALLERESGDNQEYESSLHIYLDEQFLGRTDLAVRFNGQILNRSIFNLQGLLVPRPGIASFRFLVNGREIARSNVAVSLIPVPVPGQ